MSHEIKNEAIELSADELDVVAGGATGLSEFGNFFAESNQINSLFKVGASGTESLTQVVNQKVSSSAGKSVFAG
ncbi:CTB family bacteriocin [Calothrix sp. PCC 6303]|uniref:CTB family bacteriocin n=1 Tax=Calothrix sp. PCC 6303 TaxID=1170562 RepID=UPI0002A04C2B|nr:CTB family bacteriocin [Calothrix sp. PCC 6303]AFZ03336.1 hypothetical protein Cal6303_4431 [Calothrix sp. PCC 6303]AFZ03337.1 hypothetical protein Cal6303_4432 [Calothrix sp. PCC 6303]